MLDDVSLFPRLREQHGRGRREGRSRRLDRSAVKWAGLCTAHELTVAVITCTIPAQHHACQHDVMGKGEGLTSPTPTEELCAVDGC